jgi:hypothetical protein
MVIIYRMVLVNKEQTLERKPFLVCTTPEEALKAVDVYGTDGFHFVRLEIVAEVNYISKRALTALKNSWATCKDGKASPEEKPEPEAEA